MRGIRSGSFIFSCLQVAEEAGLEVSAQLAAVPNSTIGESLVSSSLLNFLQGSIHTLSAGILPDVIWGKTFEKKEEKTGGKCRRKWKKRKEEGKMGKWEEKG